MKHVARALLLLLTLAPAAHAQDRDGASGPALGVDVFVSDDADDTEIARLAVTADWAWTDARHYRGLKLEHARLAPVGSPARTYGRAYLRFAGTADAWEWTGQVGTDGDHLLGSASLVRAGRWRSEAFVERDLLETRGGLARGQVATFAGAAIDIPLDDPSRQLTLLGGVQDFEDGNRRDHLRANLVQVVSEASGVSAQLRVRAYRNSEPGRGDYFSPRAFVEAVPVLQVRRRWSGGWTGSLAAGWGAQRHTGTDWRAARLVQASLTSPVRSRRDYVRAAFTYSDTPGVGGAGYGYRQATLQWVHPF